MRRHQKAKAASLRADDESFYQPSWMAALIALALAALLIGHGMARADEFSPPGAAQLPDSIHGPGADRLPPARGCSDAMDFSPEDNVPSPFDADLVSFHGQLGLANKELAHKAADSGCRGNKPEQPQKV